MRLNWLNHWTLFLLLPPKNDVSMTTSQGKEFWDMNWTLIPPVIGQGEMVAMSIYVTAKHIFLSCSPCMLLRLNWMQETERFATSDKQRTVCMKWTCDIVMWHDVTSLEFSWDIFCYKLHMATSWYYWYLVLRSTQQLPGGPCISVVSPQGATRSTSPLSSLYLRVVSVADVGFFNVFFQKD